MAQALIRMEAVRKVFVTDEVETHALEGIEDASLLLTILVQRQ